MLSLASCSTLFGCSSVHWKTREQVIICNNVSQGTVTYWWDGIDLWAAGSLSVVLLQCAALGNVIHPVPSVDLALVQVEELPWAVLHVILPGALVAVLIGQSQKAMSIPLVIVPLPLVHCTISIVHPAPPTPLVGIPLPLVILVFTVVVGAIALGG